MGHLKNLHSKYLFLFSFPQVEQCLSFQKVWLQIKLYGDAMIFKSYLKLSSQSYTYKANRMPEKFWYYEVKKAGD